MIITTCLYLGINTGFYNINRVYFGNFQVLNLEMNPNLLHAIWNTFQMAKLKKRALTTCVGSLIAFFGDSFSIILKLRKRSVR